MGDFFMKTEGKPTVVDETETCDTGLSIEELQGAVTTSMVTEDGQKVIIIIAPDSPSETQDITTLSPVPKLEIESDPERSPSPSPQLSPSGQDKPRKKYARSKPPKAPSGPYPTDKDQLTEMETEFKYLKKLMTEAGLGRYAAAVKS